MPVLAFSRHTSSLKDLRLCWPNSRTWLSVWGQRGRGWGKGEVEEDEEEDEEGDEEEDEEEKK